MKPARATLLAFVLLAAALPLAHAVDIDPAADIVAEATSASGAVVLFSPPATHDPEDGDGVASCAPASGSTFPLGATTVTCTATDSNGNEAAPVSFEVRVVDTVAPTIEPHGAVIVQASSLEGAFVSYYVPRSFDATGNGFASCAPASASLFPLGSTVVTCTAVDAAGNAATPVVFEVRVELHVRPTLATESPTYSTAAALVGGVRGAYRLETSDGAPLAGVPVKVRVTRDPALPFFVAVETHGTTDSTGRLPFEVATIFQLPGEYSIVGTVLLPGIPDGSATGHYEVLMPVKTRLL